MNNTFTYKTRGTCSQLITFNIADNRIVNVEITGGCDGNLTGISRIIKNMNIDEVIHAFQGVPCGNRGTSCPDQIAAALKLYKEQTI